MHIRTFCSLFLLIFFQFCTVVSAIGQCNELIDPSKDCSFLFSLYNTVLEDDFCSRLPEQNQLPELIPFCNNISTSDNTGFFVIEPITSVLKLKITPINCTTVTIPGQGSFSGLQAAIFEDCTFQSTIDCAPTCHNNEFILGAENFTPFKEYILAFDGCTGSVCDFKIEVVEGQISDLFPLVDPILSTPESACENEQTTILVEGLPLLTEGEWTINGTDDFEIQFNGKAIEISDWNGAGTKEICATIKSTQSTEIYFDSCWNVMVLDAPALVTVPQDSTICPGDKLDLIFTGEDYEFITWTGEGLSCENCPVPVFTMGTDTVEIILNIENELGCQANHSIQFFPSDDPACLSSSNDLNKVINIQIGPNPFSNSLLIAGKQDMVVTIIDVSGRLMEKKNNIRRLDMNTEQWGNGIYFVKIEAAGKVEIFRVLKL